MDVDEETKMAEKLSDITIDGASSDVAGSGLFGFHTPKSAKSMMMKAFDSASKSCERTPKSARRTPKSTGGLNKSQGRSSGKASHADRRKETAGSSARTPLRKGSQAKVNTPRRLKARNEKDVDTSSDESYEEDDDDELASLKENIKDPSRYQKLRSAVEEYFLLHEESTSKAGGGHGPRTSNRTLARLGASRPDALEVRQLLKSFYASKPPNCYFDEREELIKDYRTLFPKWAIYLQEGFNVLLYGLGSKMDLIKNFCDEQLAEEDYIVVRGYMPNVSIRNVLRVICEQFVDARVANKQIPEQLDAIREVFSSDNSEDLYVVVHNIDGPLFRNEKAQSSFCHLAACKKIHIIASVDHINAPLLWSSHQLGQLNWLWHDCTTFAPYLEETAYENSLLIRQGEQLMLSSLRHVMASLTQNAREIFLAIAKYQLEASAEKSAGPYEGYSLDELYWRSRDACLVNNEVTLRVQLTEFKDHKLIRFKKAIDGTELVLIPLDDNSLQEFVTNVDEYMR